ncbi:MAG: DUF1566 domain-containing protein [Thioploca sp.]|nr:DUF1566 domain-containing protein [Thioploca sp.]
MIMIRAYLLIMMFLISLPLLTLAGNLEPPGPPGSMNSAMYSVNDICERLKTGAEPELKPFRGPTSGPGASSGCNLNEVMAAAPKREADGAQASEVLIGKSYWSLREELWGKQTGTMVDQGNKNYTPRTENQKIAAGYYNGDGIVYGDEDLKSANLKEGVELFGVVGNYNPLVSTGDVHEESVLAGKTFSNEHGTDLVGTMVNQGAKNYTPSANDQPIAAGYYDGSGEVKGDANLISSNIKAGVTIFGVPGNKNVVDTSSGNANSSYLLEGQKAWVKGKEITGSLLSRSLSGTSTTVATGIYGATTLEVVDADLVSSNIKSGVTIFGVPGDVNVVDTSSGDALASEILNGKKAWVDGNEVTGTGQISILSPVPKTGQTTCYDAAGTLVSCSGTGQDGEYQIGVTKSPRFTDHSGDGTVTDNLTGLIWLKNANCFGMQDWSTALAFANRLEGGSCGLPPSVLPDLDWRLPTLKELQSLIDYSQFSPALPVGHPFLGVQSLKSAYWTATSSADTTSNAWSVSFRTGSSSASDKATSNLYVWPIKGRPSSSSQ